MPKRGKSKRGPVRSLREFYGLTRRDFGAIIGISEYTIRTWENGQHPRPEMWKRIRTAFVELAVKNGRTREDAVRFVDERLFPVHGLNSIQEKEKAR